MATPVLKRTLWLGIVLFAAGVIAALAFHGSRPRPGEIRFKAAGVMRHLRPEQVTEVDLVAGDRRWRFGRTAEGEWANHSGLALDDLRELATRINRGLRFLHGSAPQRVMSVEELGGRVPAEFGLDPPRYTVIVRGNNESFSVEFGAINRVALAQYARVRGRGDVIFLPRFIGKEWEALLAVR